MKLTSVMTRYRYVLPLSIDLDKCEKIGEYSEPYRQGIGKPANPYNEYVVKLDHITVYRTYDKLIGTEFEYIACIESADSKELIAFPANGDDLVNVNCEFLGNWKDNKLLSAQTILYLLKRRC